MSYLVLRDVSKSYGGSAPRTPVVRQFNLSLAEGECVALLGDSGSGKSTILSLVAGLTLPDFGSINLGGRPIVGPGPDRLFLSQTCALLPGLTVLESLSSSGELVDPVASKQTCRRRVERLLDACGLTSLARKRSSELSIAQRKRVALARTLVNNPDVLLLDDPFAGVDATTRNLLQAETAQILAAEGKTCLLATDDPNDALMLADRIIVLTADGRTDAASSFAVDVPRPRERRQLQQPPLSELRRLLTTQRRLLREPPAIGATPPSPHFESSPVVAG